MKNFSIFLTNVGKFLISGVISFSKSYFFTKKIIFDRLQVVNLTLKKNSKIFKIRGRFRPL